jgi:hypothetical protein
MPSKNKEVIFTPLAEKQLLAAKYNSLNKRGNSPADTKKYFTQVIKDIRKLATGEKAGAWTKHSNFSTRAKAGRHNAMLFETKTHIYIVGFLRPEQDAVAKLVDEEQLLKQLGKQQYAARLKRHRERMGPRRTKIRKRP